jgi:putative nucleotidyltransferase with HDIG domain
VPNADDNKLIEAILASGVKIPTMPMALLDVLKLEQDDDTGPHEYAEAIGRDPGMSGAVFRVANSPVMGLRARVDSLEIAIALLGLRTTVGVARSEALRSALHDPQLAAALNVLWVRSNTVADFALATARALHLRGVREDFVFQAGIFHDCGIAVLCRRDRSYAESFKHVASWPDVPALDAQHGTSHAVVGLMVARNWQLPDEVAQAIRHHHTRQPETLPEVIRALCTLIQFACHVLVLRMGGDDSEWENVWKVHAEALFRHAGCDLGEVEQELVSLSL